MTQLPDFLKKFQSEAEKYLSENKAQEIEFAGGTYQVQIIDPETQNEEWAFVQLDNRGQIKDCFCSCESPESDSTCVHLACAYMRIFQGHRDPLHQRFQNSLWNVLCRLFADRIGYHPDALQIQGDGSYTCTDNTNRLICELHGQTPQAVAHLKELIEYRKRETEETSLKFSNLSQEEITLWREGRPGSRLRYELSYWNDLAKWMMLLQDRDEPYRIDFQYSENGIPKWLEVSFQELDAKFYLYDQELHRLIPALATVKSPLKVYQIQHEMIEKIIYDQEKGSLQIIPTKEAEFFEQKQGISIGGWNFVEGDGFYPTQQHELIDKGHLLGKDVGEAFDKYLDIVSPLLEGEKIYKSSPVRFSYHIAFDEEWNLHVVSYVDQLGDLTTGFSRDFGHWVYVENIGFYPVEERRFDQVGLKVPHDELADFVRLQREWLNTKEGFHTHLASLESRFTYRVTRDNRLQFTKHMHVQDTYAEEQTVSHDFGSLIYIEGRGFYPKSSSQIVSPISPKLDLKEEQIGNFIRANAEELKSIAGFFSEKCPVGHAGIKVELTDRKTILIEPEFSLYPEYREKNVRFFDDFVYVPDEGFFELPHEMRLPDRFRHTIELEPENISSFLTYELSALKRYASSIDHRLLKPETLALVADELTRDYEKGKEWYRLKLRYQSSWGSVSVIDLLQANQKKQKLIFSDAGLIDIDDHKFSWLKQIPKERYSVSNDYILLSTLDLIKLNVFDEIQVLQSHNLIKELSELQTPAEPDLKGLNCSLRPYQELGVHWLWFLYHHNLSGLLCDDMGLGKTHQSMALMAAIMNDFDKRGEKEKPKFLVVCPTSVLYHWQEKLESFLPGVKVYTFYGTERNIKEFRENYDILLTSYGIWRIQKDVLSQIFFELAVFDEVQIAKNHNSRIHHALASVKAQMRLGLTGTPVENYLRELKALFDLVLPSYMPNHTDYRRVFIRPIEREDDVEKKKLLRRFINPFVMRRKKADVLIDLPAKTEEISHCDLAMDQKLLYVDVIERSRKQLIGDLENPNAPVPYIHIFAVLTHLKQICDHPAVYLKESENYQQYQSGKWDLFLELLHEALDSHQKVVVYSQFLNMLDIIENHLHEQGIEFAALRGATRKRGEEVRRFNQDPKCQVFVGSLNAAGLGIDLTAASVVIHYDRWWNAARENQATDRIHRIGQKRGVQVFKLVTKGTFEERIDAMIMRKGKLMEDVVGLDDHQLLKKFNRDEILALLQYVEEET